MKKLLFTLALIITSIGLSMAQPYAYWVSGYVTNTGGGAVANQAVNYNYYVVNSGTTITGTTYTNSNGYYSVMDSIQDTMLVMNLSTQCSGTVTTMTAICYYNSPSATANFTGCGTTSSCSTTTSQYQNSPSSYTINATSTGVSPFVYQWSNGSSSNFITVQPTSTTTYCVTVTDANGCISTSCQVITVSAPSCAANFTAASTGSNSFQFTNTSTFTGNATYLWDFGDGNTSTAANPSHTYASSGNYAVYLFLTSSLGCQDSTMQTVNVAGTASCLANFTFSVSGNTIAVTNQSSGGGLAMSYNWYLSNGATSTAANPTFSVNGGGTYNLLLVIQTAQCMDSTSLNIVVAGAPCSVSISQTSTAWNTYQFTATTASTGVNFSWNFGDGNTSSLQNPSHTYATAGTYNVQLGMWGTNCVDSAYMTLVVTQPAPANSVSGNIYTANVLASNATVYLIEFDSTMAGLTLTAIDSLTTTTGSYSFTSAPSGSYLVKAALNASDPYYSTYMPTYHTSSMYWYNANMVFTNSSAGVSGADIYMVGGTNPGGPGFIGGAVSQGANKMDGIGDPIENVLVFLLDANGDLVSYVYSDANGQFEFDNLALGTYTVYAEIAGLPTTSLDVTLTQANLSNNGIYVKVNSGNVVVEQGAPQSISEVTTNSVKVYPNPASDNLNVDIYTSGFASTKYAIVDAQGRTVATGNNITTGINTIDVSSLSSGVYVLKIEGVAPQRFIK